MQRPPIPLDHPSTVQAFFADVPLRVRPRMVDLVILAAGEDHQAGQIALLDDLPQGLPQHERAKTLNRFWRRISDDFEDMRCVAVAVCRFGHLSAAGEDLAWHDAIRATAGMAGLDCCSVFLSTPAGTTELLPRAA